MNALALRSAIAVIVFCACGVLQLSAASPRTEIVQYASGSETVRGFLAVPGVPGRRAGILMVHGDPGLTEWIQNEARNFAAQGYVALAVDLYRGRVAADDEEAHELARGVPDDRALRDVEAGFAYLASRKDVSASRIAAIGWQTGGWFALELAIHEPKLAACAVSDTALPAGSGDIAQIHAAVLGSFGADQKGITANQITAFQNALRARDIQADMKIYSGAGGDFENPADKNRYRAEAAADVWSRELAFFSENLKK